MSLQEGLVSHYELNEDGYATRADSVGSNDLATGLAGGIGLSYQGIIDRCAVFGEADYLRAASPQVHKFSGDFTISCWIRPDVLSNQRFIVDKANANFGREFRIDYYQGALHFRIWDDLDALHTVSQPIDIVPNAWYHIVAVKRSDKISIAIDGDSEGPPVYLTIPSYSNPTNPATFAIGSKSNLNNNFANFKFKGRIDEVSIWDRALSEADQEILYNGGYGLPLASYPTAGEAVGPPPPPAANNATIADVGVSYDFATSLDLHIDVFDFSPADAAGLRDFINEYLNV